VITLVDYGLGNILAFRNLYKRLNIDVGVARSAEQLAEATKLILPGVGAFDHAMRSLDASGMRDALDELVMGKGVPVLGVCVGMQMLGKRSDEGVLPGLGWIDGLVRGFKNEPSSQPLPLPHMGWNDALPRTGCELFGGFDGMPRFYFLHSFCFECTSADQIAATTEYGVKFASAVASRNVYGAQFHPEKSHHYGEQFLKNFAEL